METRDVKNLETVLCESPNPKMILRQNQAKLVFLVIILCFFCSCSLIFYILSNNMNWNCECESKREIISEPLKGDHKLCILVPFRDRFEELLEFAPYIYKFLSKQNVEHEIYILHQVDKYRFNRAYLINVGFRESNVNCDYIAMHDVDLLPSNPDLLYKYPESGPLHLSGPGLHPKYDYPTFIGGILLISRKMYSKLDGMSNKYWGWGLEDDEFFVRMRQANLVIERPKGIRTGKSGTFRHVHITKDRPRDNAKCYNQRNATRRRDKQTGLSNTLYTVASRRRLIIDGALVHFLDIELECDRELTPWCNCTGAPPDTAPIDRTRDEDVVVPLIPKKKKTRK